MTIFITAKMRAAEAEREAMSVQRYQAAINAGDKSAQRAGVSAPGAFPLLSLAYGPAAPAPWRAEVSGALAPCGASREVIRAPRAESEAAAAERAKRAGGPVIPVARPAVARVAYGAAAQREREMRRAAYLRAARAAEAAEAEAAERAAAEREAAAAAEAATVAAAPDRAAKAVAARAAREARLARLCGA